MKIRVMPWYVIAAVSLSGVMLMACSSGDESTPVIEATERPVATPPATTCGLPPIPASSRGADLSWNGWNPGYTPLRWMEEILGADAIVRGRVLNEVVQETDQGFNQLACIWVEEVYRGATLAAGDTFVAGWPAPLGDDPGTFDDRIGYRQDADYLLLLRREQGVTYRFPVDASYITWLRDVYPLYLTGAGAAPSQDAIDSLLATINGTPDLAPIVDEELSRHGLEKVGGLGARAIDFSSLPNVPGTVSPGSAESDLIAGDNYSRMRDAIAAGGYDWSAVAAGPAFLVSTGAKPAGTGPETTVAEAQFVVRNGTLQGAFLGGREDSWALDQYSLAAVSDSAPPRNRAGPTVNLADWFGTGSATAAYVKGGDRRVHDGILASSASLQTLLSALDRSLETHPMTETVLVAGCSITSVGVQLAGGWLAGLLYDSTTDRLYAPDDGFYVDAPPEISSLLGVVPLTEGECRHPYPKATPAGS